MAEEEVGKESYHLILKGKGVTIDKVVDVRVGGAIAQMALGGVAIETVQGALSQSAVSPTGAQQADSRSTLSAGTGQRLSLREYLQRADVDRGIHGKILAVGRYLRDYENQNDFSREDIRARFRSAGEPQPANFHRDFQKAVRAGWVAEDHQNRDRFYVTRTGDDEIDRRQGSGQAPAARSARPRRRSKRQPTIEGSEQ
jgi:hypothetical protein